MRNNQAPKQGWGGILWKETMSTQTEKGVTVLEIAISIPLFLAIIFFVIWIAVTTHARNSLHASVANAVRMAYTRGDAQRVGKNPGNLLSKVQGSMTGGFSTPHHDIVPMLRKGVEGPVFSPEGWYRKSWTDAFGTVVDYYGFLVLPPKYIMAVMYAHEGLGQRTGGKLKYPCDPRGDGPNDGPGCLQCANINPMSLFHTTATHSKGLCERGKTYIPGRYTQSPKKYIPPHCQGAATPGTPSPLQPKPTANDPRQFNTDFVGLHCEYMPDNILLRPIYSMLRILGVHDSEDFAPVFSYGAISGSSLEINEGVWL